MAAFCLFGLMFTAASCIGEKAVIKPVVEDGGGDKPPGYPKPPPKPRI